MTYTVDNQRFQGAINCMVTWRTLAFKSNVAILPTVGHRPKLVICLIFFANIRGMILPSYIIPIGSKNGWIFMVNVGKYIIYRSYEIYMHTSLITLNVCIYIYIWIISFISDFKNQNPLTHQGILGVFSCPLFNCLCSASTKIDLIPSLSLGPR